MFVQYTSISESRTSSISMQNIKVRVYGDAAGTKLWGLAFIPQMLSPHQATLNKHNFTLLTWFLENVAYSGMLFIF